MYQSIVYKEWIKTQKVIWLLLAVFLGLGIYSFMKIAEDVRLTGTAAYWEAIIQKDISLFPFFKYAPLLSGFLLGITQYLPELQYKRLKLTLHLPLNENRILSLMLLYGFSVAGLLQFLTLSGLLLGLSFLFTTEIVYVVFWKLLPWFIAGWAAYLLTAWVCLEPLWKRRISNMIAGICVLSFFFIQSKSGAYQPFIPYLATFVLIAFSFPFYSVMRFKEGIQ
ncbi:MAG: hypothetical protein LBP72_05955 [Dysgonamonadaceae bacterium]|jgi:hypothetical protein|nr:hypothetical protein [Dysgonamonadaceae bacterium]